MGQTRVLIRGGMPLKTRRMSCDWSMWEAAEGGGRRNERGEGKNNENRVTLPHGGTEWGFLPFQYRLILRITTINWFREDFICRDGCQSLVDASCLRYLNDTCINFCCNNNSRTLRVCCLLRYKYFDREPIWCSNANWSGRRNASANSLLLRVAQRA